MRDDFRSSFIAASTERVDDDDVDNDDDDDDDDDDYDNLDADNDDDGDENWFQEFSHRLQC